MIDRLLLNAHDKYPYFSNFGETLLYALVGFIVVFVGISILIFFVWLVGKLIKLSESKGEKKIEDKGVVKENDEIDDETLAVITAAISAYYMERKSKCEFVVKSIKKI